MKIEAYKIKTNIKLGREIFEHLPCDLQPIWAKHILACFDDYMLQVPDSIKALYSIIDDKYRWREAYRCACEIREYGLWNLFDQPEEYFQLAESIARATYNASGNTTIFDKRCCGW
ncbi:MAG: hypothetical protein LBG19_08040 [Prevotellaceae bacterium]|jgi:hypothetical protein|nr:hypothetical protein [Prevotellaceae bacterium]